MKQSIDSYTHKITKEVIKPGDNVLITPSLSRSRSFVGKVSEFILNDETNEVEVKGVYYYRQEDFKKKYLRDLPFIGKNEVFESSHELSKSAESIERTCKVLSEHDYSNLKIVDDATFFQRLRYDHLKKNFEPNSTLKVFCKCKLPHNPDYPMIQCKKCKTWYHPRCVNIKTQSMFDEITDYTCDKCKQDDEDDDDAGNDGAGADDKDGAGDNDGTGADDAAVDDNSQSGSRKKSKR